MRKLMVPAALLVIALSLSGCPSNDEQFQRPRSGDQPAIYNDQPPVGTNSHGY